LSKDTFAEIRQKWKSVAKDTWVGQV